MIVINKKINSVDEFVFSLINSRLPVIFYPWNFTPLWEATDSGTSSSLKLHSLWEICN